MVDLTLEDRDPVVGDDDEIRTVVAGDVEVNQFVDLVVEISTVPCFQRITAAAGPATAASAPAPKSRGFKRRPPQLQQ